MANVTANVSAHPLRIDPIGDFLVGMMLPQDERVAVYAAGIALMVTAGAVAGWGLLRVRQLLAHSPGGCCAPQ